MNEPLKSYEYKITAMPLQRSHRRLTRQDKLLSFLGHMMMILVFFGGLWAAVALICWMCGWKTV